MIMYVINFDIFTFNDKISKEDYDLKYFLIISEKKKH